MLYPLSYGRIRFVHKNAITIDPLQSMDPANCLSAGICRVRRGWFESKSHVEMTDGIGYNVPVEVLGVGSSPRAAYEGSDPAGYKELRCVRLLRSQTKNVHCTEKRQ